MGEKATGQEQRGNGLSGQGCWGSPWRTRGSIPSSVEPQPASCLLCPAAAGASWCLSQFASVLLCFLTQGLTEGLSLGAGGKGKEVEIFLTQLWNTMALESYGMGPSGLWFAVIRRSSGFQGLLGLEKAPVVG